MASKINNLKRLQLTNEFPVKFWDYLVNPITGFPHSQRDENSRLRQKKY
tara:strand:+ start:1098 stop:1244 length:147 start_codon:yes stop_codon:yes gene_type:complete